MGQSCEAMSYEEALENSCIEPLSPMSRADSTPVNGFSQRYPSDEHWKATTPTHALTVGIRHPWDLRKPLKALAEREDLFVDAFGMACDEAVLPLRLPIAAKPWKMPQHVVNRRSLRAAGWFVVVVLRFQLKPSKRSYDLDKVVADNSIEEMDLDLPRASMLGPSISTLSGRIRALLLRHLAEDPELGYCQGMHLVAAVFSKASGSQEEAYMRFQKFMRCMRGLWTPGFPLLQVGAATLELVAKNRPWYQYLVVNGVESSMFLPQALMTMFTMWLPLETVVACLAIVENKGLNAMVATAVAILDHAADRLLAQQGLEGILGVLQALPECPPSADPLQAAVISLLPDVSKSLPRSPPPHPEATSPKRRCPYKWEPHTSSVTHRAMEVAVDPL